MYQNAADFSSPRKHVTVGITACDIALQAEMWCCITLTHSVHTDKLSALQPWYSVLALIILDLVLIACWLTLINIRSPDVQKGSSCAKQLKIFKASSDHSALPPLCPLSSAKCVMFCCVWWACSSGLVCGGTLSEWSSDYDVIFFFSFTSLSLPFSVSFILCMCHAERGKSLQSDCEMSQIHKTLTSSFQLLFIINRPYFIFLWEDL